MNRSSLSFDVMSEKAMSELKYGDWWELETLKRISTKAVDIVEGEIVDVYSDKKNVQHMLKVGTTKSYRTLQCQCILFVTEQKIKVNCKWVPRAKNVRADILGKLSDCGSRIECHLCIFTDVDNWLKFGVASPMLIPQVVNKIEKDKCNCYLVQYICSSRVEVSSFMGYVNWYEGKFKYICENAL